MVPPAGYWEYLATDWAHQEIEKLAQLEALKQYSDARQTEFKAESLPFPEESAGELLDHVAADGWFEKKTRQRCPNCDRELDTDEAQLQVCPHCGSEYRNHGGVSCETVYVRWIEGGRSVEWVIAIHGMNTAGPWQEALSWYLSTTWGQSVPVAIYKFGKIRTQVLIPWCRTRLQNQLRERVKRLHEEASRQGFTGKPDVIAHSFGTWLVASLLREEASRPPDDRLEFGRIILTGCIVRPDFDWTRIKQAGVVDEILNHVGSRDGVVPWAHATIWNSGPSGRRGFDTDDVLNVRTGMFGHSDFFSISKCISIDSNPGVPAAASNYLSMLEYSYSRYWRPFLTLPARELPQLPDSFKPTDTWHQCPLLLRGTIFPIIALPLILFLITLCVTSIGGFLGGPQILLLAATIASFSIGILLLLATYISEIIRNPLNLD